MKEKENKSPAFQFYVQDFLMGTLEFSAEEVGGYIRLLCHQWDKGGLPNDDKKLIQLSGLRTKTLPAVKQKFTAGTDGLLRNDRLEKVRAEQKEYRDKQKARAEKRWCKPDATNDAAASKRHESGICQNDALQSSSSPSSSPSDLKKEVGDKSPSTSKKPEKKKPEVKEPSIYTRCMAVYCTWFEKEFGTGAKIDGQQGKAMKDLIAYFRVQVNKKLITEPATEKEIEDGIEASFRAVFEHWNRLELFYQQKTKLSEINSNIQNIIVQIKNPKQNGNGKHNNGKQISDTPIWRKQPENA